MFIHFALDESRILKHVQTVSNCSFAGEALPLLSSEHEAGRLKAVLRYNAFFWVSQVSQVSHTLIIAIEPMPKSAIQYPMQDENKHEKTVTLKATGCCGAGVLPEPYFEFDAGPMMAQHGLVGLLGFWRAWSDL